MRRYPAKSRRRINRRWVKYTFTRMVECAYNNIDPGPTSNPEIQLISTTCPLVPAGNLITPASIDTVGMKAVNTTNFSAALIFKLNNLPNMDEFFSTASASAGLFEEYRIKGVQVEFVPVYKGKDLRCTTGFTSDVVDDDGYETSRSYPTPTLWYVTDYDNTNSLGFPAMHQITGLKKVRLDRDRKFWIKPSIVVPSTTIAGTTYSPSMTKKRPWITNRDLSIPHYGMRFFMQDWPGPSDGVGVGSGKTESAIDFQVRVLFRYFFECRGVV